MSEEELENDNIIYGQIVGFDRDHGDVQGEEWGWKFRRGGLSVKRGWLWSTRSPSQPSHWRIWPIDHYKGANINTTKMPITQYYWMGPGEQTSVPWPTEPRERKYEFYVLNPAGPNKSNPKWESADLGSNADAITAHNKMIEDKYSAANNSVSGGQRRKTRRRRRQSKRFSKTKK